MITEYSSNCIICGKPNAERHHLIFGRANRVWAEKFDLTVPLCFEHHRGNKSVHMQHELTVLSQICGQLEFEKKMCAQGMSEEESRKEFFRIFGRSYL